MIIGIKAVFWSLLFAMPLYSQQLIVEHVDNPWQSHYMPERVLGDQPTGYSPQYVASNSKTYFSLNLHNSTQEDMFVDMKINSALTKVPHDAITFRQAVHIRSRSGELSADAMPVMNPGDAIYIPCGESSEVFVTVSTRDMDPGSYVVELSFDSQNKQVGSARLAFTVVFLQAEENLSLDTMVWDCSLRGTGGGNAMELAGYLSKSGVNSYHLLETIPTLFDQAGNIIGKPDFSAIDKKIDILKPYARSLLLRAPRTLAPGKRQKGGQSLPVAEGQLDFRSPAWENAVRQWLAAVEGHMYSKGLNKKQWVLYLYDEYLGRHFVDFASEIKKNDKDILIFANPAGKTSFSHLNDLVDKGLVDILCPVWTRYYQGDSGEIELAQKCRQAGVKRWFYFCGWPQKDYSPLKFYRSMGWKAKAKGLDGVAFWTATGLGGNKWGGSAWDDFDGSHPNPDSIYYSDQDIVSSRRWLAFEAGLEDYKMLSAAESAANALSPHDSRVIKQKIQEYAVSVSQDPGQYHHYKQAINHILSNFKVEK